MNNKKLKGFTLVELIIVIGLMSVLMVMVGLILKPISQVFSDTASYTKDRQVMDGIAQYLDESIKYADNIIVIYDKDYMTLKDSDFGAYIATLMNKDYISMSTADKEAYSKRIQGIAIINDCSGNCTSLADVYDIDDFENNSGIQQMGRVYKSAYIDGARKEWLVGGEAFYGDSSYFINIEGQDGDGNGHIDSAVGYDDNGDGTIDRTVYGLSYTIYSLEPREYDNVSYTTNLATVDNFKGKTREDIKSMASVNPIIKNYAEKKINFVNKPFSNAKCEIISPVNGDKGANVTEGNYKNSNAGTPGVPVASNAINAEDGYNIYIYYTVPE